MDGWLVHDRRVSGAVTMLCAVWFIFRRVEGMAVVCQCGVVTVRARFVFSPSTVWVSDSLAVHARFGLFAAKLGLATNLAARARFGLFHTEFGLALASLCVRVRFGLFPAALG